MIKTLSERIHERVWMHTMLTHKNVDNMPIKTLNEIIDEKLNLVADIIVDLMKEKERDE